MPAERDYMAEIMRLEQDEQVAQAVALGYSLSHGSADARMQQQAEDAARTNAELDNESLDNLKAIVEERSLGLLKLQDDVGSLVDLLLVRDSFVADHSDRLEAAEDALDNLN